MKCPECGSLVIFHEYEYKCSQCGIVLAEERLNHSLQRFLLGANNVDISSSECYGNVILHGLPQVCMGYLHESLSSKWNHLRLRNISLPDSQQVWYRIIHVIHDICQHLEISQQIKEQIYYLYQKKAHEFKTICNQVTFSAACVLVTCLKNKVPITLDQICTTYRKFAHRVNRRLIIRDCMIYGLKVRIPPSHAATYVTRYISQVIRDSKVRARIQKYQTNPMLNAIERELTEHVHKILKQPNLRLFSLRPQNVACAAIYAGLYRMKTQGWLATQEDIARICEVPAYSIRDIFVKYIRTQTTVRPIRPRQKNAIVA